MAKINSDYWQKRFGQIEQVEHNQGAQCYADIERLYRNAQRQIEGQIEAWCGRFATNNNISLTEAKRLLTTKELSELKWDIQEYIRYGQENAVNGVWVKQLENASARYHISRLEAVRLQMQQSLEVMFGNQLDSIDQTMRGIYKDGFYRTAFEVQKGFGVGWDFATLDEKQIAKIINKPWAADGKNFSSRIWENKQKLVNELNTTLTQGVVLGQNPQKIIDTIARKMNTSKKNAGRLVMTEQAFFSEAAQHDSFGELGVELYEIVATLDSHTSDICQEMDGKKFKMSDWKIGETAPPFHVYCRSTTVPAFDDEFDLIGERAARGADGKTYYVPSTMTYKEWQKSFVDGNDKSGLKQIKPDDTIELKKETIQSLDKLKKSGMSETDYDKYLSIINNHGNSDIVRLYKTYADKIEGVTESSKGEYSPIRKSLVFNYPKYEDMNRYGTLAHEYGHFFDAEATFDNLHFEEIQKIQDATGLTVVFKNVASSSDEFLAAVRKDREYLKSILSPEIRNDLLAHNASNGVQDAIDGLFPKSRIRWGHGEKYYNRKYSDIVYMDKLSTKTSRKKLLQQIYKDLGLDASNQAKTKTICRQYEAASEMWANIMSAEICGGESLEYVKKYLPNSYQAMLDILKGVK